MAEALKNKLLSLSGLYCVFIALNFYYTLFLKHYNFLCEFFNQMFFSIENYLNHFTAFQKKTCVFLLNRISIKKFLKLNFNIKAHFYGLHFVWLKLVCCKFLFSFCILVSYLIFKYLKYLNKYIYNIWIYFL